MSILTADELKNILKEVQADEKIPLLEIAEGWLHWFKKKGDRYIKDAAKLGYTEVTLDLPIEIAQSFDRKSLIFIQKTMKELLEGCFIGFIEDEYDEKPICRLIISWK
uniref:Uncharacterized protein n=1 Tax=viral metagenome TaxID=1070528 RepID=A0A6C0APY1_9ZZZZ